MSLRRTVLLCSCIGIPGCGISARASAPTSIADSLVDGIIVFGGTIVRSDSDTVRADIAFERRGQRLVLSRLAPQLNISTRDSIDARGAYLHPALDRSFPIRVGDTEGLVIRQTWSLGSPVLGLIGFREREWRPILPSENSPTGPVDPRVGCYNTEIGEWDDPAVGSSYSRGMMPAGIRLHWQYLWQPGRDSVLVATDLAGQMPSERVRIPVWYARPDSITVVFSHGFGGVSFRVRDEGADLVGVVQTGGDRHPGPTAAAPARLRRVSCPT